MMGPKVDHPPRTCSQQARHHHHSQLVIIKLLNERDRKALRFKHIGHFLPANVAPAFREFVGTLAHRHKEPAVVHHRFIEFHSRA